MARFLSRNGYGSKTPWQHVKKTAREAGREDGISVFGDTIQETPYTTDENELACWHFDHTQGRSVKGINLLNCLYRVGGVSFPVAFEPVCKPHLKTLKSDAALPKSPTQRVRAQGNHVFLSVYAAFRLECLSIKHKPNHFALRAKLYLKAVRLAFGELQALKCVT